MNTRLVEDWRARPAIPTLDAAFLLGCSRANIYALARAGKLRLLCPAGRTLVQTADLVALLDRAPPHVPDPARTRAAVKASARVRAARRARIVNGSTT